MVFSIISGILGLVLKSFNKSSDNATALAVEKIRKDMEDYRTQVSLSKAKLGHPVAWLPEFLASLVAVLYLSANVVDSIWQLPGAIAPLDAPSAAVLSTIFASMFFRSRN